MELDSNMLFSWLKMNILKWESIEIGLLLEPVPRNCSFWLFCSGLIIQPPEHLTWLPLISNWFLLSSLPIHPKLLHACQRSTPGCQICLTCTRIRLDFALVSLRQYSWLPADFLRIAVAVLLIKSWGQRRILFFCTFDRRMLT